jgi:seryl-tRNA synthetase
MAEVAELKTTMPELELAAKAADEELAKELAAIPNLPLDEVPDGADEHGNVQRHVFGRRAITRSRRSRMTISAARSATWISRPRRNCPARALSC